MIITTIARIAAAAAATTLLIGSAASAAPSTARPPEPASVNKADVRYCVIDEITGSRFTKRTCKTREAWVQDENFDPVAFIAAQKK